MAFDAGEVRADGSQRHPLPIDELFDRAGPDIGQSFAAIERPASGVHGQARAAIACWEREVDGHASHDFDNLGEARKIGNYEVIHRDVKVGIDRGDQRLQTANSLGCVDPGGRSAGDFDEQVSGQ